MAVAIELLINRPISFLSQFNKVLEKIQLHLFVFDQIQAIK